MGKVIGVIGSRKRKSEFDYKAVYQEIMKHYKPGDWVCTGDCKTGGDAFAIKIARREGIPFLVFPPGDKASSRQEYVGRLFARNDKIAEHSDILIAIACMPFDINAKGGTNYTCRKFCEKFDDKDEAKRRLFIL
jgi:hypothetical protein